MLDLPTFTLGIRVAAINTTVILMAIINFTQPSRAFPLIPTGSLIQTNSKLGHELIAGPVVGTQQVVGHKEPGVGTCPEYVGSALQRYQFTRVIPPVSNEHGMESWRRMEQQFGNSWAALDNCQHSARRSYYGVPSSPTVEGLALVSACALLLWTASQED